MKNILILLVTLIGFVLPQDYDCEEPIDVWFKTQGDINSPNFGKLIRMDMSSGYATTDGLFIYLMVFDKDSKEQLVIIFPIGKWKIEEVDKSKKIVPKKQKEEFDLDEYLKKNKGKGRMINANITKVGD
jgi:hypothetical protein